MASDLETLRVEIAHLAGIEIAGSSQESSGEIEGCVAAKLAEHGRCGDQVGLAAIVKRDTNARLGRIANGFADVQAPPAVAETEDAAAAARISIFWQVIPYILMTVAEVCISVVGLELASPPRPPR